MRSTCTFSAAAGRTLCAVVCFLSCLSWGDEVRRYDHGCIQATDRRSLRKRFYSNELSRLNHTEVLSWMRICAGVDVTYMTARLETFEYDLSGLALWDICVVQRQQYLSDMKIDDESKKAIISAFCKELQGGSCLQHKQSSNEGEKSKESEALLTLRDNDGDHRLSQSEMLMGTSTTNFQANQLFKNLDKDGDSFLSRKELVRLKRNFFRSPLSHLTGQEVQEWLRNPDCFALADEISSQIQALDTTDLSGLALWDFAVLRPKHFGKVLGIDDDRILSMIQLAVLREVGGRGGCLSNSQQRSWILELCASLILFTLGLFIRFRTSHAARKGVSYVEFSQEDATFLNDPKKKRWTWPVGGGKKRVRFSDQADASRDAWWLLVMLCGGVPLLLRWARSLIDWSSEWLWQAAEFSLQGAGFVAAGAWVWRRMGAPARSSSAAECGNKAQ